MWKPTNCFCFFFRLLAADGGKIVFQKKNVRPAKLSSLLFSLHFFSASPPSPSKCSTSASASSASEGAPNAANLTLPAAFPLR